MVKYSKLKINWAGEVRPRCWALENLRPLKAIENIKKGNKLL